MDLTNILLKMGLPERSLIERYIAQVANKGLAHYKIIVQTGKKAGETLYTHVLNGVFVLERLRALLSLTDEEAKVLFAAYTIHDMNKLPEHADVWSYNQLVRDETVAAELERMGMAGFFPDFYDYLPDIVTLARAHSAHYHTNGELLVKRHNPYRLGRERIDGLKYLMRAADVIDLSHTLEERVRKADSLSHLNTFSDVQYDFVTHRLTEQRGILSNVIHNRLAGYLAEELGLTPLLFYPSGVAYLVERGREFMLTNADIRAISASVAAAVMAMTAERFPQFIQSTNQGIKVDAKCLALGLPFESIFHEVSNKIAGKSYSRRRPGMEQQARRRARERPEKEGEATPEAAAMVEAMLAAPELLPLGDERMQLGELVRTYYIFLSKHFAKEVPDAWAHIYELLEIPKAQRAVYGFFDARYDRPYVLARDLALSYDEGYRRIVADGGPLLASREIEDERTPLFAAYVDRYVEFSFRPPKSRDFADYLARYEANQHQQCVHCGSEFETAQWMKSDVRGGIKVQCFSDRLSGGPGEPSKNVCELCRLQFLLEKLNYRQVRGEQMTYLHLYPYSFLTDIFLKALRGTMEELLEQDVGVLFLKTDDALRAYVRDQEVRLIFTALRKNGQPQVNGAYLPRYAETVGNVLIFPLNPPGQNDSERFLYALYNALLFQKHFGCKALLSSSAVPPLGPAEFGDLFVADVPLAFRGLLPKDDHDSMELERLWGRVRALHELRALVYTPATKQNEMLALVRALGEGSWSLFATADRLLEARVRADQQARDKGWLAIRLAGRMVEHLNTLVQPKGGEAVKQLQELAKIAWQGKLKGQTWERSSLLKPFDIIFDGLEKKSEAFGVDTVQAQVNTEIFEHLYRIAPEGRKPGRPKREKVKGYVAHFFDQILAGVYGGNLNHLLADAKGLRAAYLFHLREQINQGTTTD